MPTPNLPPLHGLTACLQVFAADARKSSHIALAEKLERYIVEVDALAALLVAPTEPTIEVDPEDDGAISIDFHQDRTHSLTMSVSAEGRVSWAFVWGEHRGHGNKTVPFGVAAVSPPPTAPGMGEAVLIPKELLRQLRHYTDCYLSKWPSCGAPTEAEIDAELIAAAPKGPSAGEAVAWRYDAKNAMELALEYMRESSPEGNFSLYQEAEAALCAAVSSFHSAPSGTARMLTDDEAHDCLEFTLLRNEVEAIQRKFAKVNGITIATHPAPEATKPPLDAEQEREKFEAWANVTPYSRFTEWGAWQARAALAATGDQGEAK